MVPEHDAAGYSATFSMLLGLVEQFDSNLVRLVCLSQGEQVLPNSISMIEVMRHQRQQGRYVLDLHNMQLLAQSLVDMMIAVVVMMFESNPQDTVQVEGGVEGSSSAATLQEESLAQEMNTMDLHGQQQPVISQEKSAEISQHHHTDVQAGSACGISAEARALRLRPENVERVASTITRLKQQWANIDEISKYPPSMVISEDEVGEYAEVLNRAFTLVEQVDSDDFNFARLVCLLQGEHMLLKLIAMISLVRYQHQQITHGRYFVDLSTLRMYAHNLTKIITGAGLQPKYAPQDGLDHAKAFSVTQANPATTSTTPCLPHEPGSMRSEPEDAAVTVLEGATGIDPVRY
ncbi:hypothetical protein OF83DRAFT_1133110 [Amylostereum chailletii]|nr:hypothetical protein OF83DRAFT_1133110 [Amylostereum chailletii]